MSKSTTRYQAAQACLDYNQTFAQVYVSSDLQCFQHKGDAVNHAISLDNTSLEEFKRDEDLDDKDPAPIKLTAEATIALIFAALSEEEIVTFLGEDTRKTVLAAAEKQRAILKQKALDDQADEADKAHKERDSANPGGQKTTEDSENQDPA